MAHKDLGTIFTSITLFLGSPNLFIHVWFPSELYHPLLSHMSTKGLRTLRCELAIFHYS